MLPLVLPPSVMGFYLLQLLGRRSMLGHFLEHTLGITLVFHWSGAVVASAVAAFPLFLLPARGAFEAIDPGLEDVARLLGRNELSVFWSVTLPLARRGLAAGMVLAFARALGDFGATLMVAGNIPGLTQTAALAIYDAVQVNDTHRAGWLTFWISLRIDPGARGRAAHPPRARALAVSVPCSRRSWKLAWSAESTSRSRSMSSLKSGLRDRHPFRAVGGRQDDLAPADLRARSARRRSSVSGRKDAVRLRARHQRAVA